MSKEEIKCEEGQILVCVGNVCECHWVNTANTLPSSLIWLLLVTLLIVPFAIIFRTKPSNNRRVK